MIDPNHLREHVIEPTLKYLDLYSPEAVDLLLGTCAQESAMGRYLVQIRGPALGVYQMEPATYTDSWENYICYRGWLADKVNNLRAGPPKHGAEEMVGNLYYATAMARVHYLRDPRPIPKDLEGQAEYWKRVYNTHLGKGTPEKYIVSWHKYVERT